MFVGLILVLMAIVMMAHIIDYRMLKNYYFRKNKWDLNISCGPTDGGGINADIIKRDVPNFILIKNVYKLPFRNKQFKNAICSHTLEHVDNPDRFFREVRRVSKNVVILIPPVWDLAAVLFFMEHKWQFLTFRTRHINRLPRKVRLPYYWYQKKFGQRVA